MEDYILHNKADHKQEYFRDYVRALTGVSWGGHLEIAVCSYLKKVNIHVYKRCDGNQGFNRMFC